ncbi:hypothetical protein [Oerskovia flava]|uniref:hypothetical protein n=1 Tax=Oerskovia flava TaxID=2986422 RepID=UPI0022407CEB|nr:hypothetical protein [Oerskovia sp. JB1-3-2]
MSSEQDAVRPEPRRRVVLAGALALALGVGALVALLADDDPAAPVTPPDVPSASPPVALAAQEGDTPVCGFPVLDAVTHDGVDQGSLDGVREVVGDLRPAPDHEVLTIRARDGVAHVLAWDRRGSYTVTRYDVASGSRQGVTEIGLEVREGDEVFTPGQLEVGPDGSAFLLDTIAGRRDLVRLDADGGRAWTVELPEGPQTQGSVLDLYGMVRWPGSEDDDAAGADVIGVLESGEVLHRVTADGRLLAELALEGEIVGQLPDGGVVVETSSRTATVTSWDLRVVDPGGAATLHLGATRQRGVPFGVTRTPWIDMTGVTAGPGGNGLLVVEEGFGFRWFGDDGVSRGLWPDSRVDIEQPFALRLPTPVVAAGEEYLVLTHGEGEAVALTAVTADRMAYQLRAPLKYNAANEEFLSTLGLGAGLVTGRVLNVFDADEEPRVVAAFDPAWGAHADRYRLRYTVRGDPRVWDPVAGEERVVDLPPDGGDVVLDLPAARPGAYEVDAALVERDGGAPVAGTCLRYTVAAPGAELDPESLADGADWGGASPVRGVQLADRLGVGSHRLQLDFGAIVPDPTASPDAGALVWDSLPDGSIPDPEEGEDDGAERDPFAELAAAAELAADSDVHLILQLGSGGEAENAAVEAGTWGGWARQIVAAVRREAPEIVHWQPWNEPNTTGFGDAAEYERRVGAPFARAARAAHPGAVVVGGNTLGIVPEWWDGLVAAGGCDSMDVVGIHPYTGLNRSWEEEGFSLDGAELDQLREVVAPCGDLPLWDTESGWWSDGVANLWAGGSDVARKLLWYGLEPIEEWTYFFSEGGFGEADNSWSLVQYGAYVKPAAVAFAATAGFLEGFGPPTVVPTGTPGVHAVRAEGADGSGLLALWSEDLTTTVRVLGDDGPVAARLRDQYGAERDLSVAGAPGTELTVNGAPLFLVVPPGASVSVEPVTPFGDDVLAGRPVAATSTHEETDAAAVTSGTFAVREPWRSGRLPGGAVDEAPAVEITTDGPQRVDRIAVATAGIRCCTGGLRDYTVSVRTTDGTWRVVAEQTDQFHDRVAMFAFEAVEITAVRVAVPMTTERDVPVLAVNYSGVVGGLHPSFMPLETESEWTVAISAVQAWAPG